MKENSIWSISRGTRKCGIYEKVSLINFDRGSCKMCGGSIYRADSRLAPSQWETSLQSNAVSRHLSLAGPKPRISPDLSLFPYKIMTINRLRPKQNGRHFTDDIFKCIFLKENVWILIKISLHVVTEGQINNISTLVQTMTWHRQGIKPLSEPMMVRSPMHICVTQPEWVKKVQLFHNIHANIWGNWNVNTNRNNNTENNRSF